MRLQPVYSPTTPPLLPMSSGSNEVETSVHTTVRYEPSRDPSLFIQELFKLGLNVLHYGGPAVGS